jgi:hypothetical protein
MVTRHFMEKRMVSATESRKITKLIERVALITFEPGFAAGQVETQGRADFVTGIVDERFHGDECTVRGQRLADSEAEAAFFAPDSQSDLLHLTV